MFLPLSIVIYLFNKCCNPYGTFLPPNMLLFMVGGKRAKPNLNYDISSFVSIRTAGVGFSSVQDISSEHGNSAQIIKMYLC